MFNPLFPYGLNPANGFPIGNYWNTQNNNGYNCAPTNGQYFLGWTNLFNVINAMVSKASGVVNVYELEFQQEMNVLTFTAQMRLIYDNSMSQSAPPQYVQTSEELRK